MIICSGAARGVHTSEQYAQAERERVPSGKGHQNRRREGK